MTSTLPRVLDSVRSATDTVTSRAGRLRIGSGLRLHAALALVTYVPLLLTQPGWVSADTKTYLYTDPARLLGRAWSTWDPSIGMGTVTHQTIGYLWPMGPYYWVMENLGVPDWTAQRLWWGSIMFLAGAGMAYLLRTLSWRGPGVTAATFVYALSPYVLTLVARLSALLLPFAALPWLLALTVRAVRHRGWRYPALFALVVTTCGSINATALLLVGLAPVLWLVHAVWGSREATPKQAALTGLKMGALTLPVSAWWIAGLSVQSTHGLRILRYTETAETVAEVSVSHEILRGLGYWFFYGTDRLGPWIEPSVSYTQWLPLIAVSYLLPILGLAGAAVSRWRHRAYFVLVVLVGTTLAVGAYPWGGGTMVSRGLQAFLNTDTGLAMRSLPRAVPLVALGLAVLLGAGIASVARRWPGTGRWAGAAIAVLAVAALPSLWLGQFVPDNLRRQDVPEYWHQAAEHVDARGDDSRVLVVPGSDFASYRWGNTVDPVLPGLADRPTVARELIPYGSPASANLLNALDLGFQERTADPASVAPIARLMRAGDVLVQSDLQYERYNTPRPRNFWDFMTRVGGLDEPARFGPGDPNVPVAEAQLYDELYFATDADLPHPPEVAVFPVEDPLPIVSTQPTEHPLLVAGDGAGLVDAAALGLIDGTELIRYSASLTPDEIGGALEDDAALLLTDTNRKRGERWSTVRHTQGYTETADGGVLDDDLTDNRLPLFPDASTDSQTIAVNRSGISARASSYGNPITYTGEERAANAVDDNEYTAWRTSAFSDARGERLELTLTEPVTTNHIRLKQPHTGAVTRFITEARLTFDGGDSREIVLDEASRGDAGQVVTFPERTFSTLTIEILTDSLGEVPRYAGQSSVGFTEVDIGDDMPVIDEVIRLPRHLLDGAGADSLEHPLAISFNRQRQDATDVTRNDEEHALARMFSLPTERSFSLRGRASVSFRTDAHIQDELLGRPHDDSVTWARSSGSLTGTRMLASSAVDGDPDTAWTTLRSRPLNQWIEVVMPEERTVDTLPLTMVTDGQHSVPTQVEVWVDGEVIGTVDLPDIEDGAERGATTTVDVDIPEVTGSRFRVKLTGVREVETNDWVSDRPVAQPAAIAEIDLPGAEVPALEGTFDTGCRDDLLFVNGDPTPIRITGPMEDAVDGAALNLTSCGDEPITLDGGEHEIRTESALFSGISVNRLLLRSAAGGEASTAESTLVGEALTAEGAEAGGGGTSGGPGEGAGGGARAAAGTGAATPGGSGSAPGSPGGTGRDRAAPQVEVVSQGPDELQLQVTGAREDVPFWLVLGQSYNTGWEASIDGATLDDPRLVDGFANGWQVVPDAESFRVDLRFAPQQRVDVALWLSVVAALGCLVLAVRRPRPAYTAPAAMPEPYSPVLAFRYNGALPARSVAVVAGVGVGVLAWLTAGVLVGAVTGVATAVGARHEKFRRWLLAAGPAALGLALTYVLYIQFRWSPVPSYDWPLAMDRVHPAGWLAVWLMVADVVVGRLWQARSSEHHD